MENKVTDNLSRVAFLKSLFVDGTDHLYRIPLAIAFILLAVTPAFLIIQQDEFADQMSTLAFFLLVMGIGWLIALALRKNKERRCLTKF